MQHCKVREERAVRHFVCTYFSFSLPRAGVDLDSWLDLTAPACVLPGGCAFACGARADTCQLLPQATPEPAAQTQGATLSHAPITHDHTKPDVSTIGLMCIALAETDDAMGAAAMFKWFTHNYPYFEHHTTSTDWKQQIRVGLRQVRSTCHAVALCRRLTEAAATSRAFARVCDFEGCECALSSAAVNHQKPRGIWASPSVPLPQLVCTCVRPRANALHARGRQDRFVAEKRTYFKEYRLAEYVQSSDTSQHPAVLFLAHWRIGLCACHVAPRASGQRVRPSRCLVHNKKKKKLLDSTPIVRFAPDTTAQPCTQARAFTPEGRHP